MTDFSTINQFPLPEDDDIINYNEAFGGYARAVDTVLHPRFATTAARDAAITVGGGRTPGMQASSVTAPQMFYDDSTWDDWGAWTYLRKGTTETRASSTSLVADSVFTFGCFPTATYEVEGYFLPSTTGTAGVNGFVFNFLYGGAKVIDRSVQGSAPTATAFGNYQMTSRLYPAATDTICGFPGVTSSIVVRAHAIFTTVTGTTFTVNWGATNAVGGANVNMFSASYIRWRRLTP